MKEKLHEIIFEADTPNGKFFDFVLMWAILNSNQWPLPFLFLLTNTFFKAWSRLTKEKSTVSSSELITERTCVQLVHLVDVSWLIRVSDIWFYERQYKYYVFCFHFFVLLSLFTIPSFHNFWWDTISISRHIWIY